MQKIYNRIDTVQTKSELEIVPLQYIEFERDFITLEFILPFLREAINSEEYIYAAYLNQEEISLEQAEWEVRRNLRNSHEPIQFHRLLEKLQWLEQCKTDFVQRQHDFTAFVEQGEAID